MLCAASRSAKVDNHNLQNETKDESLFYPANTQHLQKLCEFSPGLY